MSDKTFGVKVSEEVYDRVKNMVEASGISAKEWFEKAVALTAIQDLKDGAGDYKQDLSELEIHTTRIYELVANMIQRSEYMKMDATKELAQKIESRDFTITELQGNVKKLTDGTQMLEETAKLLDTEKKELMEQVESLRSANENNQSLIQEYKEKIDTLSSLVNEYKGYAKENNEIKVKHATELDQLKIDFEEKERRTTSLIEELRDSSRDLMATNEQLKERLDKSIKDCENEVENLNTIHNNQLTQLAEKKELEKERAVLEVERIYQERFEKTTEQYNEKIAHLYEKFDTNTSQKRTGKSTPKQ